MLHFGLYSFPSVRICFGCTFAQEWLEFKSILHLFERSRSNRFSCSVSRALHAGGWPPNERKSKGNATNCKTIWGMHDEKCIGNVIANNSSETNNNIVTRNAFTFNIYIGLSFLYFCCLLLLFPFFFSLTKWSDDMTSICIFVFLFKS